MTNKHGEMIQKEQTKPRVALIGALMLMYLVGGLRFSVESSANVQA